MEKSFLAVGSFCEFIYAQTKGIHVQNADQGLFQATETSLEPIPQSPP